MEIKIIEPGDNRLKQVSKLVTDFNKDYASIIEKMKVACLEKKAYACAAPQLGILERFILIMVEKEIHTKDLSDVKIIPTPYFNPIIRKMEGEQIFWESCMSVKETVGKVRRPYSIILEAQDINGKPVVKRLEGFETIVYCHEIDHLDGIEFIDRALKIITNITADERFEFRKTYPHQIIRTDGEFKY